MPAGALQKLSESPQVCFCDETAKSPDQKFWMDCKKDKIGNFERGYSQSNHRKVTDFGLLQDFKRMIMTFGSRVFIQKTSAVSQGFPVLSSYIFRFLPNEN